MEEKKRKQRALRETDDTTHLQDTSHEQSSPSDISSRIGKVIERNETTEEKTEFSELREERRIVEQRVRDVVTQSRINDVLDKHEQKTEGKESVERDSVKDGTRSEVDDVLERHSREPSDEKDTSLESNHEQKLATIQQELDALKEAGIDVKNVDDALKDLYKELGADEQTRTDEVSEPRVKERGTWEVKMYNPEIDGKKVESFDEVCDHLEDAHPGLKEHRDIDKLIEQGEKHWKTVEHFQDRTEVSSQEIRDLAKIIDAPEPTVRAWVTKESAPGIYSTMESAMTREEAEKRIGSIREGLDDLENINALRDRMNEPYFEKHTKQTASWEKDWESSEKFYKFLDEMEKGGTIGDVSRRVGIAQSSGQRYLENRLPTLVKAGLESSRLKVKEYSDIVPMESKEELHGVIERHNYLKDRKDFPELKRRAELYIDIKELQRTNQLPDIKQRDWAYQMGISHTALNDYLQDKKRPEFFNLLNANENARQLRESKLAPEAFEHRIDPSVVYESFRPLKGIENPTPAQLAESIENLHNFSSLKSRVQFAEMSPYNYHSGPKWISDLSRSIVDQREEVESSLNKRMGFDTDPDRRMRIGVADGKLYTRIQNTSRYNWMNIYESEQFNFKEGQEKRDLMSETRKALGLRGDTRFSHLVHHMTDYQGSAIHQRPNTDLSYLHNYLKSDTLSLALDSQEMKIQDIQSMIKNIGRGKYGIHNPRFSENSHEIDRMFASLLGAGLSDGHVTKDNKGFVYTESNTRRVEIFNRQVDRFGDVYHSERIQPNGVSRTRYSSIFGRALESRGLSSGDKALQNRGFPEWLKNASPDVLCDYYPAMWAQEANFKIREQDRRGEFQWDRGVAFHDPGKHQAYDYQSPITEEHVGFLKDHGTKKDSDVLGPHRVITYGQLRDFTKHSDFDISNTASELMQIALENKSKLMDDEQNGLGVLGIGTTPYLSKVTYYEGSGRVSSLWHARTNSIEDAMRAAILTPPEDVVKRDKVEKWIGENQELAKKVRQDLEKEGLLKSGEGVENSGM